MAAFDSCLRGINKSMYRIAQHDFRDGGGGATAGTVAGSKHGHARRRHWNKLYLQREQGTDFQIRPRFPLSRIRIGQITGVLA